MVVFNKFFTDENDRFLQWFAESDKEYRYAFTRASFNAEDLVFRIFTKFNYMTESEFTERDKQRLEIYLPVCGATASPPLGTLLSQFGINTVRFCDAYNTDTEVFDTDFTLKTHLTWYFKTHKFKFFLEKPAVTLIMRRLAFQVGSIVCLKGSDVIRISRFKFNFLPLKSGISIMFGSVCSMKNIKIINYV